MRSYPSLLPLLIGCLTAGTAVATEENQTNSQKAAPVEQALPAGGYVLDLGTHMQSPLYAEIGKDGKVSISHKRPAPKIDPTPTTQTQQK